MSDTPTNVEETSPSSTPGAAPGGASEATPDEVSEAPKKKKSFGKRVLKGFGYLFLVLVILLVVAFIYLNDIAKEAIQRGGTYAMGVETKLDKISLAIAGGESNLDNLTIKNPEGGYTDEHFFKLGRGEVDIQINDLLQDTVKVNRITLHDIHLSIEKKGGKANYDVILENLKKLQGEKTDDPAKKEEPAGEGMKLVINEIDIQNVNVTIDLLPIGGKLSRTTLTIPEIQLKEVGTESDKGVLVSELSGIVVEAILAAVVKKAGSEIPGEIFNSLNQGLAGLGIDKLNMEVPKEVVSKVVDVAGEVGKQVTETVGKVGKEAGKAIKDITGGKVDVGKVGEDVGKKVEEGVGGVVEGIGNLLGGKKDKKKEEKKD